MDPIQIRIVELADRQAQIAIVQKCEVVALVAGLRLGAHRLLSIEQPTLASFFSDRGLAVLSIEDGRVVGRIEQHHLGTRRSNLSALERGIVHKEQRVDADVESVRNRPHALAFRIPGDLWMQEELVDSEASQHRHRIVVIVLAERRNQNAALVQASKDVLDARAKRHGVGTVFDECARPQRIVQIPDDALAERRLRRLRTRRSRRLVRRTQRRIHQKDPSLRGRASAHRGCRSV